MKGRKKKDLKPIFDTRQLPVTITPATAGALLHCSPRTIINRINAGDLPGEKIPGGRLWVIPTALLLQAVGLGDQNAV